MDPIVRSDYPLPPRLLAVKIISGFTVHLTYANGVEREIDLEPHLQGPIFEPIRNDPALFAQVQIDEVGDTICWPNGADIAPETLYYEGEPPWVAKSKPVHSSRARKVRPPTRRRVTRRKTTA
jgi:hypothetical protein